MGVCRKFGLVEKRLPAERLAEQKSTSGKEPEHSEARFFASVALELWSLLEDQIGGADFFGRHHERSSKLSESQRTSTNEIEDPQRGNKHVPFGEQ